MKYAAYGVVIAALAFAPAPVRAYDEETAATARDLFERYRAACMADGGLMWGEVLCGPVLVYDADTRSVYTSTPDAEDRLTWNDGVWIGLAEEDDQPPYSNTSADWAGVHWAIMRDQNLSDGVGAVRLVLHESFHRIQPLLDLPYENGLLSEHLDERDGRLWLRLEIRALIEVLKCGDEACARGALHDALAFRAARYRAFPDAEERERSLEYHEGLAEYAGWRMAERELTVPDMIASLESKEGQDSFARSFAYATGPGMGLAFDRVGLSWIRMLRTPGTTFLSIGASAFASNDPRLLDDTRTIAAAAPYGYASLLVEETNRAQALAATRADFVRRFVDGRRLSTPLGYMNFDPRTVTTLGEHGQVYGRLTVSGDWGAVSTTVGGLLAWSEGRAYFDRRDPPPGWRAENPTWESDVWSLTLADGWMLHDDGRDLSIVEESQASP